MKRSAPLRNRKPMPRGKPLRARRPDAPSVKREVKPMAPAGTLHKATYAGTSSGVAVDKERASQSPTYMRAAKALGYCMRCGVRPGKGLLDFCHRDCGKGMAIKTDVREGWPGCRACHHFVGTSGKLSREERRAEELRLGAMTRAAIRAAGTWPARLKDNEE